MVQDSVVILANGIQLIGRDDRHNPRRKSIAQLTDTLSPTVLYSCSIISHTSWMNRRKQILIYNSAGIRTTDKYGH